MADGFNDGAFLATSRRIRVNGAACSVTSCTNAAPISFASPDAGVHGIPDGKLRMNRLGRLAKFLFEEIAASSMLSLDKSTCSGAERKQRWMKVSKMPGHAFGGFNSVVLPSSGISHVTCHSSLFWTTILRSRIFHAMST